jgi:molybdopterin biosynthesis enzyme MoaB
MKVGILTVSDKGARGEREDRSGPAVREMIEAAGGEVVRTKIVPDEQADIRAALIAWSDEGLDLVLTT